MDYPLKDEERSTGRSRTSVASFNIEECTPELGESYEEFNMEMVPEDFTMVVFGARGTGKTNVVEHLLSTIPKDRYRKVFLFSETIGFQVGSWNMVVPDHRYEGYKPDVCRDEIQKQRELYSKLQEDLREEIPHKKKLEKAIKKKAPKYLFIFDDVISDEAIRKDRTFSQFFTQGRHLNMSVILLSQSVMASASLNGCCRGNADAVLLSSMQTFDDWERAVNYYFFFGPKKKCLEVVGSITCKPFQFAVALHRPVADRPKNCQNNIRRFIAKGDGMKVPSYRLGDKDLWDAADETDSRKRRNFLASKREAKQRKNMFGYQGIGASSGMQISGDTLEAYRQRRRPSNGRRVWSMF